MLAAGCTRHRNTVHEHKSMFLAFNFPGRKEDSSSSEAKRYDKEDLHLIMEEKAGGNRLNLFMVVYLNGLASGFLN